MRRIFRMHMEGKENIEQITLQEDGCLEKRRLPALLYKGVLDIPMLFPTTHIKHLFQQDDWSNSWDAGIFYTMNIK
jgi:uncharacterized protein YjlB